MSYFKNDEAPTTHLTLTDQTQYRLTKINDIKTILLRKFKKEKQ